ncbi:MAG: hypothetical protein ACE10G_06220 [Gemmatimonadales bacterium]
MKKLLVLTVLFVSACAAAGDNLAVRQAKQECETRGIRPSGPEFTHCVEERSEALYEAWYVPSHGD